MILGVARAPARMILAELAEAIGGKDDAAVGMRLRCFDGKSRKAKAVPRLHQQVLAVLNLQT